MHDDRSSQHHREIRSAPRGWQQRFRHMAVVGLAAAGPAAHRAGAQGTAPTPTDPPIRVAVPPTETPAAPGNLAAPPTPTTPSTVPEEVTPPPEPVPVEPSPTPASVAPDPVQPTPTTAPVETQPEDPQATVFPWNPFCGPGPFGPWIPVVAPPDVTALSGIRWYGLEPDPANNAFRAAAFGEGGDELGRGDLSRDSNGGYQWSLTDGQTRIEASFAVERDGPEGRIVGEIAGQPFSMFVGDTMSPRLEMDGAMALDDASQALIANWQAVVSKTATMFDIFAPNGTDPAASPGKCFASGFMLPAAIISCPLSGLGCAAVSIFGGYIWNNCTD